MLTLAAISLPEYFIGYALIMVFSITLGLLPSDAIVYDDMGLFARLMSMVLPCATLSTGRAGAHDAHDARRSYRCDL